MWETHTINLKNNQKIYLNEYLIEKEYYDFKFRLLNDKTKQIIKLLADYKNNSFIIIWKEI